jgi:hypothetical protein
MKVSGSAELAPRMWSVMLGDRQIVDPGDERARACVFSSFAVCRCLRTVSQVVGVSQNGSMVWMRSHSGGSMTPSGVGGSEWSAMGIFAVGSAWGVMELVVLAGSIMMGSPLLMRVVAMSHNAAVSGLVDDDGGVITILALGVSPFWGRRPNWPKPWPGSGSGWGWNM